MTFEEYMKGRPPKTPEEEEFDMRILACHAFCSVMDERLERKKAAFLKLYRVKPDDLSPENMRTRFPGMYWEGEREIPSWLQKALEENRGSAGGEDAPSRRVTKRRKRPSPT